MKLIPVSSLSLNLASQQTFPSRKHQSVQADKTCQHRKGWFDSTLVKCARIQMHMLDDHSIYIVDVYVLRPARN